MIPENRLSSTNLPWLYLSPDQLDPEPLEDWELGGVALNDPSEGLEYQVWRAHLRIGVNNIGNVWLSADNHPESLLFTRDGVTEISLTFDQNMNPFIAFMQNGEAWYWWYDTAIGEQVFTQLPTGCYSPKAAMDDKRYRQVGDSDIILGYVRDGGLYYRMQRDRFLIEYDLNLAVSTNLLKLGMNKSNRLQFAVGTMEYPPGALIHRVTTNNRNRITTQGNSRKVVGLAYE